MNRTIHSVYFLTLILLSGCDHETQESNVQIVGAMKNVMWKGELGATIQLVTIKNKIGLYGVGPLTGLQGEILLFNGTTYVSHVLTDSTMKVEVDSQASAPFFVYGNQTNWQELELHKNVRSLNNLEQFMNEHANQFTNPYIFKLEGFINTADIHVQNLPPGTEVHSPKEAHQGQTNYQIEQQIVEIIGFYSTKHHGIFTHQNSNMHLHLITKDRSNMGHLDAIQFDPDKMVLYVPSE